MRHAEIKLRLWQSSACLVLASGGILLAALTPSTAQTITILPGPQAPGVSLSTPVSLLVTEGDRLLQMGDIESAADTYLRAARSAPTQPLYQIIAGVSLASAGRMNEALSSFRRADDLARGGDVLASLLVQGILAERSDDSAEAQALYARTVKRFSRPGGVGIDTASAVRRLTGAQKQFPQSAIICLLLGDTYQLSEQWTEAEASYKQAIRLAPGWVKPRINLGLCQLARGRSSEAMVTFQRALDLDPGNAQAQIARADAQLQSGFVDDAVLSYRKLENSSNSRVAAQAATGIGQAYAQRGQVPEAVQSLNKAKKLDPSDPTPAAALAEVQSQVGNYSAAAREYTEALRLSGAGLFASKGVLYRALTETQLSARNGDGAIETINRALSEEPANKPLWYRLWAQALYLKGDAPGGEAKLRQALESEGSRYPQETLNALNARQLVAKISGDYERSLAAAEDDVTKIRILRPLASIARFQGIPAEEVRYRETLTELKSTGPEWFALAEARERNGDAAGARAAYQKAVQLRGLTPAALRQAKESIARLGAS